MRDQKHTITLPRRYGKTQTQIEILTEMYNKALKEIRDLHGTIYHQEEIIENLLSDNTKIKSEAIKEFAERLKEKERPTFPLAMVVDIREIDNLVKEMEGEHNEM